MTKYKIHKLADFFYSSDSSDDIPMRISAITGQYSGFDLPKEGFIELLTILNRSKTLRTDLEKFVDKYGI
jgi:hypothetical protein